MTFRTASGMTTSARARRAAVAVGVAVSLVVFDARAAMAQIVESDVDAQPGTTETTQLVTSSTEVRRAVVGLLLIAAAAALVLVLYWYLTGQQARERYAQQFAGRHAATSPQGVVAPAQANPWNDPRPRAPVPMGHGPVARQMPPMAVPPQQAPPAQPMAMPTQPQPPQRPAPQHPGQPVASPHTAAPAPAPRPDAPSTGGGLYPTPPARFAANPAVASVYPDSSRP